MGGKKKKISVFLLIMALTVVLLQPAFSVYANENPETLISLQEQETTEIETPVCEDGIEDEKTADTEITVYETGKSENEKNPQDAVSDGLEDDILAVADGIQDGAARIGDVTYDSVKEAVEAAADGETVVLLKDIDNLQDLTGGVEETVSIFGKSIVLDGADKKITGISDYSGTVFTVESGAEFTLKNLTIDGKTDWTWSYTLNTDSGYGKDYFSFTVADRTFVRTASFIKNNGSLVLEGVKAENIVSSEVYGAIVNSTGNININNSTFTDIYAEMTKSGTLVGSVIYANGGDVVISNINVNNCGTGSKGKACSGGFAAFNGCSISISGSKFVKTFATENSGVFNLKNVTSVTVSDTDFDSCVSGNDGGMSQLNCSGNMSEFTFTNCDFYNMTGTAVGDQSLGSVMYVSKYKGDNSVSMIFNSCGFYKGLSSCGVFCDGGDEKVQFIFNDCEFIENQGGVFWQRKSDVVLNNCIVKDNTGNNYGSAVSRMSSYGDITLTLNNTTVTGNKSTVSGGAIYMANYADGATSTVIVKAGSEITGNSTDLSGGAIFATRRSKITNTKNTIIIEEGAKVCNNKASVAGDDISARVADDCKTFLYLPDAESMNAEALADGAGINGWYSDPIDARFVRYSSTEFTAAVNKTAEISEKLDLKAEVGGYTIKFDGNAEDLTGTVESQQIKTGQERQLNGNGFIRPGYVFAGWNTEPDGSGISYSDGALIKNLTDTDGSIVTLYAQWLKNYTIIFDPNGGSWSDGSKTQKSEIYTEGTVIELSGAPSREGYEFLYWEDTKYNPKDSYTVTEDHTFKAVWKEKEKETENGKASGDTPTSGDNNRISMWIIIAAAAAVVVIGCVVIFAVKRKTAERK